jgi:hypothetical protein
MAHPTITNFGLLDPALLQKEVETTHASAIFDTFSVLDPRREELQIAAVQGSNPFAQAGIMDPFWTPKSMSLAINV